MLRESARRFKFVRGLGELERRLEAARLPLSIDDVTQLLRSHSNAPIAICCHDPDNEVYANRQETLASIVLDLSARRYLVSDGAPCQAPYDEAPVQA